MRIQLHPSAKKVVCILSDGRMVRLILVERIKKCILLSKSVKN